MLCIFGWLVSYAIGFMLSRRSRELGTYILIGLENKQMTRLFYLENLAADGAALVPGLAPGGLLYQILRAILFAMFGFFLSFASGVPAFFEKRPTQEYQGQNLLIFRTLTAKLATMGIIMAVISVITWNNRFTTAFTRPETARS